MRLLDAETQNRGYVRAYETGYKHMVVVSPEGIVENQTMLSGNLITQFAYNSPGRQEKMEIEWLDDTKIVEGRRNSIGRSSGNPNLTPESANDPELSLPRHSSSRPSINNNNINRENITPKNKVDYAIAHHGTPHTFEPEPGFPNGRCRLDKIALLERNAEPLADIRYSQKLSDNELRGDKNRASEWFRSRGLQLPKEGTHQGSTKNILTSGDLVKWKKDRDPSNSTPEYSIRSEETSPDPFRIEEEPMPELTEIGKEEAKGFMDHVYTLH